MSARLHSQLAAPFTTPYRVNKFDCQHLDELFEGWEFAEPAWRPSPASDIDVYQFGGPPPDAPNSSGIGAEEIEAIVGALPPSYRMRLMQAAARAVGWRGPILPLGQLLEDGLSWHRDGASPLQAWHESRWHAQFRPLAQAVAARVLPLQTHVDSTGLRLLTASEDDIRAEAERRAHVAQAQIRAERDANAETRVVPYDPETGEVYEPPLALPVAHPLTPDERRAMCPRAQRHRVRTTITDADMHVAAIIGAIGRQPNGTMRRYVAQDTLERHHQRRQRAAEYTAAHLIQRRTPTGETVSVPLAEVKASHDKARRAETYAMLLAMQQVAESLGYVSILVSATLPPEYHPNPTKGANTYNPALSPKLAARTLNQRWHRSMAAATRLGLRFFGTCGREAQADATPHAHGFLWVHPADLDPLAMVLAQQFPETRDEHADLDPSERVALNIRRFNSATDTDGNAAAKAASYAMHYALKGSVAPDDADADRHAHDAWRSAIRMRGFSFVGVNAGTRAAWRAIHAEGRSETVTCPRMRAAWFAMRRREWGRALLVLGALCNVRPAPVVRPDARPWAAARGRQVIVPALRRQLRLERVMEETTTAYGETVRRMAAVRGPLSGVVVPLRRHRWEIVRAEARPVSDIVSFPRVGAEAPPGPPEITETPTGPP